MDIWKGSGRTHRMLSLFVATALVAAGTAGCSDNKCVDRNKDGYCDDGGGGRSGYYGGGSGGSSGNQLKNGASTGTSSGISKGGIGSSGSSSS
ncbi:hypothetical protein [Paenibacillus puerhi]|uniref:hypothetical protein n=1 Tax=Paenibacillus puerhi TaxID=2692622 RepID=UPI00135694DA|nr:hypothetical protein [Paenibacillus puerhi]